MDPERDYSNLENITKKCFYIAVSIGVGYIQVIFININVAFSYMLFTIFVGCIMTYTILVGEIRDMILQSSTFSYIMLLLVTVPIL